MALDYMKNEESSQEYFQPRILPTLREFSKKFWLHPARRGPSRHARRCRFSECSVIFACCRCSAAVRFDSCNTSCAYMRWYTRIHDLLSICAFVRRKLYWKMQHRCVYIGILQRPRSAIFCHQTALANAPGFKAQKGGFEEFLGPESRSSIQI